MAVDIAKTATLRRDAWWIETLPTWILLGGFTLYATWAAFINADYFVEPYLSPLYSPCLAANCVEGSAVFRFIGTWWSLSPALLILVFPLSFRGTCYYYRKAYYRAFLGSPPACAVRDVARSYSGESKFPLVVQNLHRYFFWLVWPVLGFLWWDVIEAFHFHDGFGIGVGTLVLLFNATLLTGYSSSCHSARHLAGGTFDVMSQHPIRHRLWKFVSSLNARHGKIAWFSLVWVGWTDAYVRLVANDVIRDLRIF